MHRRLAGLSCRPLSIPAAWALGLLSLITPILIATLQPKYGGTQALAPRSDVKFGVFGDSIRIGVKQALGRNGKSLRTKEWQSPIEIERQLKAARKNDALLDQARDSARVDAREAHELSPKLGELQTLEDKIERERSLSGEARENRRGTPGTKRRFKTYRECGRTRSSNHS